jgi:NTP pyrophosphatase (non-canonical NTP hydrolase)
MNNEISVRSLQTLIRAMYFEKDARRGVDATFLWLMEEIGELAAALRSGTPEDIREEFADVIAWLVTIANIVDCDLTVALAEKYGSGCPGCGKFVCTCPDEEKP